MCNNCLGSGGCAGYAELERLSGDAGHQGAGGRPENEGPEIDREIAMKRGKRKMPGKEGPRRLRRWARRRCGPGSSIRPGG